MEKGNLLVTANGKGHSAIAMWWVIGIVGAVVCAAIGFYMAKTIGFDEKIISIWPKETRIVKNEMYNIMIGLGVFTAFLSLLMPWLTNTRIGKTVVNVYENCVEGSSVVPKFPLSFMLYGSISSLQLMEFQLTYDKVSSVDVVNGNTIVINAGSVQHKIFTMNARKIRDEIMSRKSAVGAA